TRYVDLQVPIYREGQRVYAQPPLAEARNYARKQLEQLHPGIRRFVNPHVYPVGIEQSLHDLKTRLILQARNQVAS
ncbi:MAG TPA: nicotinate phosphoribosyltransferase, partial [Terriglobia bacterium]|nr:nicotinate phosphoribosyltransferase [Terriglobia bacterium]